MSTIIGTSNFVSRAHAVRYYADYGTDEQAVDDKIKHGEIHIGRPAIKPGERLYIMWNEGRYHIQERTCTK